MPGHGVLYAPSDGDDSVLARTHIETRKFTRLLLCYGQKLLSSH